MAFVTAQLAAQPERSDVISDLLAGLAKQMIALNQQKGDKLRGFLAWLERETGGKIEDLTGRSQLWDYLGDYQKGAPPLPFNDLLAILRKNARKLAVDSGGHKFQESLKKEYEASLSSGAARSTAGHDRQADRSGGVSAVRAHGGGDRGRRGQRRPMSI